MALQSINTTNTLGQNHMNPQQQKDIQNRTDLHLESVSVEDSVQTNLDSTCPLMLVSATYENFLHTSFGRQVRWRCPEVVDQKLKKNPAH